MPTDAPEAELTSIWGRVTDAVGAGLPASTFQLWIDPLRPVGVQDGTLYVSAPQSIRAWVERRYGAALESALRDVAEGVHRVVVVTEGAEPGRDGQSWSTAVASLSLSPEHTFERFVIGDGNRLAHAAALAVAELPGDAYNPLFLHGPPGLGKTHLLGAIGNYLRRHRPDLNLHYTTAERFTTEFVAALQRHGPEGFKQRYRGLDALLIDDVQTLEGKEQTQEEFVHTFNALHAGGKQIVLSSDRPPDALARLAERLRDRFRWGLCSELGPPDLRTRTTLLWRMATGGDVELPDAGAIREIASLAAGNVRQLEGAMTRVVALSSVLGEPVTSELVHKALGEREPTMPRGPRMTLPASRPSRKPPASSSRSRAPTSCPPGEPCALSTHANWRSISRVTSPRFPSLRSPVGSTATTARCFTPSVPSRVAWRPDPIPPRSSNAPVLLSTTRLPHQRPLARVPTATATLHDPHPPPRHRTLSREPQFSTILHHPQYI